MRERQQAPHPWLRVSISVWQSGCVDAHAGGVVFAKEVLGAEVPQKGVHALAVLLGGRVPLRHT